MREAGFDAVRIPTTWFNHSDSDLNVDDAWFERVHEVVDYAYNEGMYVILNVHHENWNDPYEDSYKGGVQEAQEPLEADSERIQGLTADALFSRV